MSSMQRVRRKLRTTVLWGSLLAGCGSSDGPPAPQRSASVTLFVDNTDYSESLTFQLHAEFPVVEPGDCSPEHVGPCTISSCDPPRRYASAGTVRARLVGDRTGDLDTSYSFEPWADGRYTGSSVHMSLTTGRPRAGQSVDFTASGGEIPGFSRTVRYPEPVRLRAPFPGTWEGNHSSVSTLVVDRTKELELHFDVRSDAKVVIANQPGSRPRVVCEMGLEKGAVVVPAGVLPTVAGQRLTIHTLAAATVRNGDWAIETRVLVADAIARYDDGEDSAVVVLVAP